MPASGSLNINSDDRSLRFLVYNSENMHKVGGHCYNIIPCIPIYLFMDEKNLSI